MGPREKGAHQEERVGVVVATEGTSGLMGEWLKSVVTGGGGQVVGVADRIERHRGGHDGAPREAEPVTPRGTCLR